uniref:Uncharacterized protein n=1 Tax=candidate division WWE3 bacterium TaxID=2053526 RepID=A0A7C4TLN5_UNCKA
MSFLQKKVKIDATICKHCRSELPPVPIKKMHIPWKWLILLLFIFGIFADEFEAYTSSTSKNNATSSSNTKKTDKKTAKNSNSEGKIINEKKALLNSYFGDFRDGKIEKKSGKIILKLWEPWTQHVKKNFSSLLLNDAQNLVVEYDEIWIWEYDEFLTEREKQESKGQLDIYKLYWKVNKVQAATVERYYIANPVTGEILQHPSHKIVHIYDRTHILQNIREN